MFHVMFNNVYILQVLDLGGNKLTHLRTDIFRDLGLTNLQKIYLPHCRIQDVEENSFR